MFRKILLPTDGSRTSEEAARIAAELSARYGGVVHPLVAVEYRFIGGDDVPADITREIRQRIQARAEAALAAANEAVREAGGATDGGSVVEGQPAAAILRAAEDGEFDLIVMGSRGVSLDNGEDRLVGSVAERVLHRTPCPVLVIRAPARS